MLPNDTYQYAGSYLPRAIVYHLCFMLGVACQSAQTNPQKPSVPEQPSATTTCAAPEERSMLGPFFQPSLGEDWEAQKFRELDVFNKHSQALAIADFNDDGRLDIILSRKHRIEMYLQAADGQLIQAPQTIFGDVGTAKSMVISPVDLNDDGLMDFMLGRSEKTNRFFQNQGDGTFLNIAPELHLEGPRLTPVALS